MILGNKRKRALVYILLLLISLICLYPFYMMLIMGTYSTYDIGKSASMLPGSYLLENLKTVFENGFMIFYKNSFYIAIFTTVITLIVSALTGYGLGKFEFPGSRFLMIFIVIAMMIPSQVGIIGYMIEIRYLGLGGTREAIILYYAANCFGSFWITQYVKTNVPTEVLESARIDGSGEWRIFCQIVVPFIKPALMTLAILQFMWNWNNYMLPLVLLNDVDLYPVTLGISRLATQYATNYGAQICALSLGTIPLILIFIFGSRYFISGLTAGAVKG
ncbi:MAG: carbohydrate ABC transporter permease [Eubacteriales bacterium]|nr:carbohydrate ABC transporter permease [Eubacteriales bacterium]